MKHNWVEVIAGAVVLLVAIIFLGIIFQSSGRSSSATYPLIAEFPSAQGISVGTDVRMSGVAIGYVDDMRINTENYMAQLTLNIESDYPIPADSEVKVSSDGLLGGAYVEIIPGADIAALEEGENFLYSSGAVSLITLFSTLLAGGE